MILSRNPAHWQEVDGAPVCFDAIDGVIQTMRSLLDELEEATDDEAK